MDLRLDSDSVNILFEVHAAVETAVPLPGSTALWRPAQVYIDALPAKGLARDKEGLLWALVPEGVHKVHMVGPIHRGTPFNCLCCQGECGRETKTVIVRKEHDIPKSSSCPEAAR